MIKIMLIGIVVCWTVAFIAPPIIKFITKKKEKNENKNS